MPSVVLIGEALGEHEARIGQPFVGPSGAELIRMLGESGLIELTAADRDYLSQWYSSQDPRVIDAIWSLHTEVARTNVFNLHPPGNDLDHFCGPKSDAIQGWPPLSKSRYISFEYEEHLDNLRQFILGCRPNIVIALGNTPLWALTGQSGITKLRGTLFSATHLIPGLKVLPTYHPAHILRQYNTRAIVIADLMKAARESTFPELRRPEREIWIEPSLADIEEFVRRFITPGCLLSVDIETIGDRITCIGFAPDSYRAIVIPFDDDRRDGRSYWDTLEAESRCWRLVKRVLENPSIAKLFQNGLYDIAFLWRSMHIRVLGAQADTMLLHHALQPEMLKGLGFLGSIYSGERSWKGMRAKHETTIKRDS